MRITLTQDELKAVADVAQRPLPDMVEVVAYTINQSLTVEVNTSGVSIMRGTTSTKHAIYVPGTK